MADDGIYHVFQCYESQPGGEVLPCERSENFGGGVGGKNDKVGVLGGGMLV